MFAPIAKRGVRIGRICYTKADGTVRVYDLTRSIVIGRANDCDIRIKQGTVSRVHCNIARVDDVPDSGNGGDYESGVGKEFSSEYYLENVSSTNQTEVNYVSVSGKTKLKEGDIITIGERDFVFKFVVVNMTPQELDSYIFATGPRATLTATAADELEDAVSAQQPSSASEAKTTDEGDKGCLPFLSSPSSASKTARGRSSAGAERVESPRSLEPKPVPRAEQNQPLWVCIPGSLNPLAAASNGPPDQVDDTSSRDAEQQASSKGGRSVRFSASTGAAASSKKGSRRESLTPEQREAQRRQRNKDAVAGADASMERVGTPTKAATGWGLWFF